MERVLITERADYVNGRFYCVVRQKIHPSTMRKEIPELTVSYNVLMAAGPANANGYSLSSSLHS
jgi:hypothetical protein